MEKLKWFNPSDGERGYKYFKFESLKDKDEGIFFTVKIRCKNDNVFLSIEGSIRKWWFGMNGFQDLDYFNFEKAIEAIGKELLGDKNVLWGYRVSILELGVNVQLPVICREYVDCYGGYSTFRKIWYEGETIVFEGKDSYSMIVYNKGAEIVSKRSAKKSKKNPEPIKKLNTRATWLRYELKTAKLSKVAILRDLANTPGGILTNWDEIFNLLHEKIKNLKLIDNTLPTHTDDFKAKNKTELKNYLINMGMLVVGSRRTMSFVDSLKRSVDKEAIKKELEQINRAFMDKPRLDLERDLRMAISRRIRKLKGNDKML